MTHRLTTLSGDGQVLMVSRAGKDMLEMKLGDKTFKVLTEDLAALVRRELPEDRGAELFSEVEEKMISKGKARIHLQAQKDFKKGDDIFATIEISKYLDSRNNPVGVRSTNFGFIY